MNLTSAQPPGGPQVAGCSNSWPRASMQLYLSTSWYLFLAATTAVGLLVSLVSNMIIIYLFTSTPALRQNPSNIIAVNLSVSDLLYCCQWPSVIYCSLTQSTWILEIYPVCQGFGFITVSTGLASVQTVLVMSIERVFVIRRNQLKAYSSRTAWLINLLIWLVCILSSLPPLFGKFNRYTLDPSKTSCTLDYLSSETNYKLYIVVLCITYWILPFLVISVSYALIFLTFKHSSLTLKTVGEAASAGAGPRPLSRGRRHDWLCHSLRRKSVQQRTSGGRRTSVSDTGSVGLAEQVLLNANDSIRAVATNISTEQAPDPMLRCLPVLIPSCLGAHSSITLAPYQASQPPGRLHARFKAATTHGSYSRISRTRLQFRLARMSLYLILLWLISWTPLALVSLLNSILHCHRASATLIFVANTMTKLGPTFDVFIYGISHPKIKIRFKEIIGRLFRVITFRCSS